LRQTAVVRSFFLFGYSAILQILFIFLQFTLNYFIMDLKDIVNQIEDGYKISLNNILLKDYKAFVNSDKNTIFRIDLLSKEDVLKETGKDFNFIKKDNNLHYVKFTNFDDASNFLVELVGNEPKVDDRLSKVFQEPYNKVDIIDYYIKIESFYGIKAIGKLP
jgi:hypothetical protein